MVPLKKALQTGGTKRVKRDRSEAKRKQVQLATVDPQTMRPTVRTVVFRGFAPLRMLLPNLETGPDVSPESCCMMFITDDRAEKVRHLSSDVVPPFVECCWWLDEGGVQFRLSGQALLATAECKDPILVAARRAIWERLQPSTRQQFIWPTPGAPMADSNTGSESLSDGDVDLADAHFALLLVLPERVDELRLGGNQKRNLYILEKSDAAGSQADDEGGNGVASVLSHWHASSWRQAAINP